MEHELEVALSVATPEGVLTPHVVLIDAALADKLRHLHELHLPNAADVIAAGGFPTVLNGWTAESLAWRQVLATLVAVAEREGYQLDRSSTP